MSWLKAKLVPFLLSIIGILAVAFTWIRGNLKAEKLKAVRDSLNREKSRSAASKKANEALIRGLEDEHESNDPRSYDFNDD